MAHDGRSKADELLAATLAAGKTLRQAAKLAGVAERTAARRWAEPEFRAHVAELRAAAVERALGRMADGMALGARELRRLVRSAASETVRLGAARALLELTVRLRESVEQEARLAALEASERERQEREQQGRGHEA